MEEPRPPRVAWRENPDAVELGFDFYLQLVERRLRGERLSLVQNLRRYYQHDLGIELRETQARGLTHRTSSVFIDHVNELLGEDFVPNVEHWQQQGFQAFQEWREHYYGARDVVAADVDQEVIDILERQVPEGNEHPPRQRVVVPRIIRDSALSRFLKSIYQSSCQICSFTFRLPRGIRYAECHHLRPLENPHQGPDVQTNMMVLCPNHHAMFGYGSIAIHPDDLTVRSIEHNSPDHRRPLASQQHPIERDFLEYHYSHIFHQTA